MTKMLLEEFATMTIHFTKVVSLAVLLAGMEKLRQRRVKTLTNHHSEGKTDTKNK